MGPGWRSVEYAFGEIAFPISFPAAVYGIYPVLISGDTPGYTDNFLAVHHGETTLAKFRLYSGAPVTGTRTYGAYWLAIGK